MPATFVQDSDYVEVCGKRTVFEIMMALGALFDRHDVAFHASSLRLKEMTFGRVVDLATLKGEILCLQTEITESETAFGFFWKTALYLHEKMSGYQERIESLKREEKMQEELRAKFEVAARGPTIPREVMDTVLGYVSSNNELVWEGETHVYVDGLLPLAVYNPHLLFPYHEDGFKDNWTLDVIAEQKLRRSVLEDASLADHIKLRTNWNVPYSAYKVSDLRPLMAYPHLWKTLSIWPRLFDVYGFVNHYTPCFPFLEELDVGADSVVSSTCTVVAPLDGLRLKTARLLLRTFADFFNTGCLNSITSLTLYMFNPRFFVNHYAFKEALRGFPRIIEQLPSLYKLALLFVECERGDLEGLPRIKSGLRSLDVGIDDNDSVFATTFLSLFADCHIDSICIDAHLLREAEALFGGVRRVSVKGYVLDVLSERNADGNLPFLKMELLELIFCDDMRRDDIDIFQLQYQLLQAVRVRFEDPTICKIGCLRIPRFISTNAEFQEEIERYVHSLVLTDWEFNY